MKSQSVLGLFMGLATLSSCAPVASSAPKLVQQRLPGDTVVVDSSKKVVDAGTLQITVLTVSQYEIFEKKLGSNYISQKVQEKDAQISEFTETRGIREYSMTSKLNPNDFTAILVVAATDKSPSKEKLAELSLDWFRKGEKYYFSVNPEGLSEETWSFVKKNLKSISFVYRTN